MSKDKLPVTKRSKGRGLAAIVAPGNRDEVEPAPAPGNVQRDVGRHTAAPVRRQLQCGSAEGRREGANEARRPGQQLNVHHHASGLPPSGKTRRLSAARRQAEQPVLHWGVPAGMSLSCMNMCCLHHWACTSASWPASKSSVFACILGARKT